MIQAEIAAELGMSQMHVSRLLCHALTYRRECLTGTSPQLRNRPDPSVSRRVKWHPMRSGSRPRPPVLIENVTITSRKKKASGSPGILS